MRIAIFFMIILLLASCAPRRPAQVDEVAARTQRTQSQYALKKAKLDQQKSTHKVVRGDSLYSIGFRYQKDYLTLAAINNIKPPYRIYPNQIIKLSGQAEKIIFKPANKNTNVVQTKPLVKNQPITAQKVPIKQPSKQATIPNSTQKTADSNTTTIKNTTPPLKQPSKTSPTTSNKPPAKKPMVVKTPNKTNLNWLWPTQGKIRTTFLASNPARKGISIGGQSGQAVKAAEAGVVVYSGNGLLGYGELIIIKHNNAYLSAYGHNKSLKVKEGQSVNRGEVIAELGSSGTNVNNLHFEIRKNGKPVNPLIYVKP